MWLVAALLGNADMGPFYHRGRLFWIVLSYNHARKQFFPFCRLEKKPREVLQPVRGRLALKSGLPTPGLFSF